MIYRLKWLSVAVCFVFLALVGCQSSKLAHETAVQGSYSKLSKIHARKMKQRTGGYYKVGLPYEIDGKKYIPQENEAYDEVGIASWYGPNFHGQKTANGEIFDENRLSAAHRTLPMPSIVKVTNLENGKSMLVRVNDRGPFAKDRIIDLSVATAKKLGVYAPGTAKVRVTYVKEASDALFVDGGNYNSAVAMNPQDKRRSVGFIQVGAFSSLPRAEMIQLALEKRYPTVVNSENGLYKVQVGPFDNNLELYQTLGLIKQTGYQDAHVVPQTK